MNPNRVFKFPRALIENRDNLQPSTISVATLIYANVNKHRNYRNSLKNIAALTHRDEKTVGQAIAELEAAGYLLKLRNYVYSRELDQMIYAQTTYHIVTPVTADYTLIPYSWLKHDLTPCTLQVLLVCRMFMVREKSRAYPSIRKLTDTAKVAKSTVCKAIKKVAELGILVLEHCKKENGAYTSNSYVIVKQIRESAIELLTGRYGQTWNEPQCSPISLWNYLSINTRNPQDEGVVRYFLN